MSRQLLLEHKRALVSREIQDDLALGREIYRVLSNPRDIDYICANNKQHFSQSITDNAGLTDYNKLNY